MEYAVQEVDVVQHFRGLYIVSSCILLVAKSAFTFHLVHVFEAAFESIAIDSCMQLQAGLVENLQHAQFQLRCKICFHATVTCGRL